MNFREEGLSASQNKQEPVKTLSIAFYSLLCACIDMPSPPLITKLCPQQDCTNQGMADILYQHNSTMGLIGVLTKASSSQMLQVSNILSTGVIGMRKNRFHYTVIYIPPSNWLVSSSQRFKVNLCRNLYFSCEGTNTPTNKWIHVVVTNFSTYYRLRFPNTCKYRVI